MEFRSENDHMDTQINSATLGNFPVFPALTGLPFTLPSALFSGASSLASASNPGQSRPSSLAHFTQPMLSHYHRLLSANHGHSIGNNFGVSQTTNPYEDTSYLGHIALMNTLSAQHKSVASTPVTVALDFYMRFLQQQDQLRYPFSKSNPSSLPFSSASSLCGKMALSESLNALYKQSVHQVDQLNKNSDANCSAGGFSTTSLLNRAPFNGTNQAFASFLPKLHESGSVAPANEPGRTELNESSDGDHFSTLGNTDSFNEPTNNPQEYHKHQSESGKYTSKSFTNDKSEQAPFHCPKPTRNSTTSQQDTRLSKLD